MPITSHIHGKYETAFSSISQRKSQPDQSYLWSYSHKLFRVTVFDSDIPSRRYSLNCVDLLTRDLCFVTLQIGQQGIPSLQIFIYYWMCMGNGAYEWHLLSWVRCSVCRSSNPFNTIYNK